MADSAALPRPSGFVFDLDGTLVDTVGARIDAWLSAFQEVAIPAERQRVADLIGADGVYLAKAVAGDAARDLSEQEASAVDRRSGELYDALNTDPRPLPGATDLLETLASQGMPWVIATSSRPEQVGVSVEALGLSRPPRIVDGSRVGRAKPEPDLLLAAAADLSLAPHAVWAVGDSRWDMRAAAAAGMVAVGVTSGATSGEDLTAAGARLVVKSLDEILWHADAGETDASPAVDPAPGFRVHGADGSSIGDIDAVFADYLLVRAGFPPVDVHVPIGAIASVAGGRVELNVPRAAAVDGRWDRPPMRPHEGRRDGPDDNPR